MRRLLACLAFTVGAVSCSAARVQTDAVVQRHSRRETVAQVLKSSVRIHLYSGKELVRAASGVVMGVEDANGKPTSFIITNEHVAETHGIEKPRFEVLVDGRFTTSTYAAHVVAEGQVPERDLAVLAVPGVKLQPATPAAEDELAMGADVVVIGAPYGKGLSVSGGMLSQIEAEGGEPTMIKTDAPVGYGASGGGMFDAQSGHLLGVIEGYRTAQVQVPGDGAAGGYSFDVPMPGETFASSVTKVRHFLAEKHLPGGEATAIAARK